MLQVSPRNPPVSSLTLPISSLTEKRLRSFEQRHLQVPKQARYAIMGSLEADLSEVWFVCHGHGQLASRFLSRFLPLEQPDRLFIGPGSAIALLPVSADCRAAPAGDTDWCQLDDRRRSG